MVPHSKARSGTEEDLSNMTNLATRSKSETQVSSESPVMSGDDLEWDTEFTASEDKDTQSLLKGEVQMGVRWLTWLIIYSTRDFISYGACKTT